MMKFPQSKFEMKRWLSLVLCIIMCVSLIPVNTAFAEEPVIALAETAGEIQLEDSAVSDENVEAVAPAAEDAADEEPAAEEAPAVPVDEAAVEEPAAVENTDSKIEAEQPAAAEEEKPVAVITASVQAPVFLAGSLATPVLKSAVKSGAAIKVTWNAVTGAAKYRVFRKGPKDSSWVRLTDTTALSYNDTNVANNTKYTYTVRCITSDGKTYTSSFDSTGVSCTYYLLATPTLVSAKAVDKGIEIKWNPVGGAAKYRLFRKKAGTSWVKVTDTTATSFVDTACSPGITFTYTVRCLSAGGSYISNFDSKGKTSVYYGKVSISSLECKNGYITVEWNNVNSPKYQLFRKMNSGEWKSVTTTTSTSYKDTDVISGNTYSYYVRSLSDDGKVVGSYDSTGKSTPYYDTPELDQVVVVNGSKITINWIAVQGVTKYRVFRKISGGSWTKLVDTSAITYTDTTAASGVNYIYTVRCLSGDGSKYISGFDSTGVSASYYGAPTLRQANAENTGIEVSWNVVGSCKKYQIYRRTNNSSWKPLDTAETKSGDKTGSFTDTTAQSGQLYFYTVACMTGSSVISDYDPAGVSCTRFKNPTVKAPTIVASGVKVTWGSIDGVTKYRVFRKTATSSWTKIADTTNTYYLDKNVSNSVTYSYTVRCLASDGSYASGYDTTGKSITYYSIPTITSVTVVPGNPSGSTGTVQIDWKAVDGVTYYNVYRKQEGDASWSKIGEKKTGTSYTDTPPKSGVKYIYTLRCSDGSGNNISYFDSTGKSVVFYKVPKLLTPTVASGSITVKWESVDKAAGYKVYRKVPGGSWVGLATINSTTTLTYKDTNVISGQQYIYTVRAFNGSVLGGYNKDGASATAK